MIFDGVKIADDGSFTDAEGCYWGNKEDYLGHLLGFCGCGCPDDALHFVGDLLELIDSGFENANFINDAEKIFSNTGLQYLVYYFLDDKGLIEHGGSVPGWLTDYGKDFLKEIKAIPKSKGEL